MYKMRISTKYYILSAYYTVVLVGYKRTCVFQ